MSPRKLLDEPVFVTRIGAAALDAGDEASTLLERFRESAEVEQTAWERGFALDPGVVPAHGVEGLLRSPHALAFPFDLRAQGSQQASPTSPLSRLFRHATGSDLETCRLPCKLETMALPAMVASRLDHSGTFNADGGDWIAAAVSRVMSAATRVSTQAVASETSPHAPGRIPDALAGRSCALSLRSRWLAFAVHHGIRDLTLTDFAAHDAWQRDVVLVEVQQALTGLFRLDLVERVRGDLSGVVGLLRKCIVHRFLTSTDARSLLAQRCVALAGSPRVENWAYRLHVLRKFLRSWVGMHVVDGALGLAPVVTSRLGGRPIWLPTDFLGGDYEVEIAMCDHRTTVKFEDGFHAGLAIAVFSCAGPLKLP